MGYHLGVDLGTTFTAAAAMNGGAPSMIGLGNRALQIPSVLYFHPDGSVLVGEAAEHRSGSDPGRTVREFKRRIGDPVPVLVAGRPFSPQALSGRLLRWVVDKTTEQLGERPLDVTLTHPANWAGFKIDLLRQVAMLANVDSVRACSEPEAAALQYASRTKVEVGDRIAVYDLGGGTFDVCVLEKTETGFRFPGRPEGIEHLGGIDFDEAVFHRVIGQLPPDALDPAIDDESQLTGLARLRRDCVEAKEALSTDVDAVIPVSLATVRTSVRLTRSEFEDIIRPALEDTVAATTRALRNADTDPATLKAMVLVGGSSRIPLVAELLGNEFRCPIAVDTHPKNDVAMGAARAGTLQDAATELITPGRRPAAAVADPVRAAGSARGGTSPGTTGPGVASTGPSPFGSPTPVANGEAAAPVRGARPGQNDESHGQEASFARDWAAVGAEQDTVRSPGLAGSDGPPPRERPPAGNGGSPDRRRLKVALIAGTVAVLLAGGATVAALNLRGEGTVAGTPTGLTTAPPATSIAQSQQVSSATSAPASTSTSPTQVALPASAPLADDQLLVLGTVTLPAGTPGQHILLTQVGNPKPLKDLTPGNITVSGIGLTADRKSISYRQDDDAPGLLRVAAADGSGARTIYDTPATGCEQRIYRPAWNPVVPTQFAVKCGPPGALTLKLINTDGSVARDLDPGLPKFDDIAFDKDGHRVIYYAEDANDWDGGAIYGLDVSGQQPPVKLTEPTMLGQDADPVVSPDGKTIAFRRRVVADDAKKNFDVWLMNADGSNQRALTSGPGNDQDPSWSPDGKTIAFKSDRTDARDGVGKRQRVWLVSVADGHLEPLLDESYPQDQTTPAWSSR